MSINPIVTAGTPQLSYSHTKNTPAHSSSEISNETSTKPMSIWHKMAQKYDIRNITPEETAKLSHALYKAGEISYQDHAMLSFNKDRFNLPGAGGYLIQADNNGRRDMIAEIEAQIEIKKKIGHNTANHERILNHLQKFDAAKGKPIDINA